MLKLQSMKKITVNENEIGLRLDKFLLTHLSQSRSQIQKIIKKGLVLVNHKKPSVHQFLKTGDVIELTKEAPIAKKTTTNKKIIQTKKTCTKFVYEIPIIYENDDYLVINKPAGLIVHPANEKLHEPSVADWLNKNFPQVKKIKDPRNIHSFRQGIVHRLDKEVSGLLILAKTQLAYDHFKKIFKSRKLVKEYLALVHGKMENEVGEINFEISRKKGAGKMAAHPAGSNLGRASLTEYTVLKNYPHAGLLQVLIKSGRTHQIRVHLNAINHPIIGDSLYSQKRFGKSAIKTDHILLLAKKLAFLDCQEEEKVFELPIPENFQQIIKKIEKLKIPDYVE